MSLCSGCKKKSDKNSFKLSKNYKEGKLIDDGKIPYYEDFTHEDEKYTKSKTFESGSNGMIIRYVYIKYGNIENDKKAIAHMETYKNKCSELLVKYIIPNIPKNPCIIMENAAGTIKDLIDKNLIDLKKKIFL